MRSPFCAPPLSAWLVLLSAACLSGSAMAAVSLTNGDFATDASGWTGNGQRYVIAGDGMMALDADDRTPYYSASGGTGATRDEVFLSVSGLSANAFYEVSFDLAYVAGYYLSGSSEPLLTLNPGGLQVLVNNAPVGDEIQAVSIRLIDPAEPSPQTYGSLEGTFLRATVTFTAPAETISLGWRALEGIAAGPGAPDVPNALLLLDNIEVTAAPVPEATASLLAGIPAFLLLLIRRVREK